MIKMSNVFTKTPIKKPSILRVILKSKSQESWWNSKINNSEYYSSIIEDKQYIYSFLNEHSANKCIEFLYKYKKVNGNFPNLTGNVISTNFPNYDIHVDIESLYGLKERCLLNNIGLIGIVSFEYSFINHVFNKKNVFDLNISAIDMLENENQNSIELIDNLNYILDF